MQVRNENTRCPGSKCGAVQNQDQIKVPHLYKKQRPKIPFFLLAHNFFFCTVGANWKRKSKHTHGHLCDRNCTCEEEEGAEQLALELWLRCRAAALQCIRPQAPKPHSSSFPLFSWQRAATQALCMALPKPGLKHVWERQGAGAGHPQLLTRALVPAGFQFVFPGTGWVFHG